MRGPSLKSLRFVAPLFFLLIVAGLATPAHARDDEYEKVVRHIKQKYEGKKVRIPFMWLARVAVKVARPAGVRSINVTMFEGVKVSNGSDEELRQLLRDSFTGEWQPVLRFKSASGECAYLYARNQGSDAFKLAFVSVGKSEAAVVRATVDADKLLKFIENPKLFGVSLGSDRGDEQRIENNEQ